MIVFTNKKASELYLYYKRLLDEKDEEIISLTNSYHNAVAELDRFKKQYKSLNKAHQRLLRSYALECEVKK